MKYRFLAVAPKATTSGLLALLVSVGSSVIGCGTPMNNNDGGDASMDVPTATDTGREAAVQPLACDPANVIDLSMAGMTMGNITRYTGDNSRAASNVMITVPANCTQGMVARAVAHTYRVRSMGFLRVSTANDGTPAGMDGHDTVVWIQDRCGPRNAMSYGCNDDTRQGEIRSTAVSDRILMPGTMVTIVVATWVMSGTPMGQPYELSVEEVAPLMMGADCDPTGPALCTTGTTCVGAGQVGRCVADGSLLAHCRDMMQCDMGLECIQVSDTESLCLKRATMGGACDNVTVCMAGEDCIFEAYNASGILTSRCRPQGQAGGLCGGMNGAMCTAPLTCTGNDMQQGTCVREVAAMMPCDPLGITTKCAMGNSCAPNPAMAMMGMPPPPAYICQPDGTVSGAACVEGAMRCSGMGLTCTTAMMAGVCQSAAMAGGSCDPRFGSVKCGGMEACASNGGNLGVCRATTAEGADAPNTPAMAGMARALPQVIRGSLQPGTDVDCYNFTLPANQGMVIQVSDGAGGCPDMADSVIILRDSMGRQIAADDDSGSALCSYLDTRQNQLTRTLPAGTYSICMNAYPAMMGPVAIMNYALSVSAVPLPAM